MKREKLSGVTAGICRGCRRCIVFADIQTATATFVEFGLFRDLTFARCVCVGAETPGVRPFTQPCERQDYCFNGGTCQVMTSLNKKFCQWVYYSERRRCFASRGVRWRARRRPRVGRGCGWNDGVGSEARIMEIYEIRRAAENLGPPTSSVPVLSHTHTHTHTQFPRGPHLRIT